MARIGIGKLLLGCFLAALAFAGCAPPTDTTLTSSRTARDVPADGNTGAGDDTGAQAPHRRVAESTEGPRSPDRSRPAAAATSVPEKVIKVLRHIDKHGQAPERYEGGRSFHNSARNGEQALPRVDARGRPTTYREWDVNPKIQGVNRGAERLVTGSDGSAYYTADHYRTFIKIR